MKFVFGLMLGVIAGVAYGLWRGSGVAADPQ